MIEGSTGKSEGARLRTLTNFAPRLGVSILNQVVSSGANFALGLYLVRFLPPAEFGIFGICMATSLLYAGFGNALFLTQMVVHLPEKPRTDRPRYAATLLSLVAAFCLATLIFTGALHTLLAMGGLLHPGTRGLILATSLASIANLLRSYFVRLAYSAAQEHKALAVNSVCAAVLALGLLVVNGRGGVSGAASALWLFSISNLAAAVLGIGMVRLPFRTIGLAQVRHVFAETFTGGRWAVGGVSVTWFQSQSYMYIIALLVGPTGVALANAARMLIAPFTFLVPAVTQVLLPRLVEIRAVNRDTMFRHGLLYSQALVALGVVYAIVLGLAAQYVIPLLVGDNYTHGQLVPVAAAWSLVLIFQLAKDAASLVLQALKEFRSLMLANTVTAIVGIAATAAMAMQLGVGGAVLGVGFAEALLAAILWKQIKHEKNRHSN